MKKITAILIILFMFTGTAFSVEFDTSVDSSIRKEYVNSGDLPPLPSAKPSKPDESAPPPTKSEYKAPSKPPQTVYRATGKTYTIKRGSKFTLSSQNAISDSAQRGALISFVTKNSVTTKEGAIIPPGTIVRARVTDSHRPQISSNGGLVELHINEIKYNGVLSPINAKLLSVNYKSVHGGDIKGKHTYWKNFGKSLTPAKKFWRGNQKVARKLAPVPIINLLAIVPYTLGGTFYILNLTASPFVALFSKGDRLYLPAGSDFVIKITSDSPING